MRSLGIGVFLVTLTALAGEAAAQTVMSPAMTATAAARPADPPHPANATPASTTDVGGINVVSEAGVGSDRPYASAGVIELGGSLGFSQAGDFTQFVLSPSAGLFIINGLQLSVLFNLNVVNSTGMTTYLISGLLEPSFHLPIDSWFALFGLGVGFVSARGAGTGLALVPRIGANFPIGRSGILTPSLTLAYYTASNVETASGSVTTVNTTWGFNVGYTVMW